MVSKKDLSEMAKKFDINGMVNNIKSFVSPDGKTPDADPDDALGIKLSTLSVKVQESLKKQQELSTELKEVNDLLNGVFSDIQALRGQCAEDDSDHDEDSDHNDDTEMNNEDASAEDSDEASSGDELSEHDEKKD